MKKIWLLVPLLFTLTGCFNYRELNDLAIVSGVSVSKVDDKYKLTVEVLNPKNQQDISGTIEPDFIIYTAEDTSIQKIFRKMIKESPKKMYVAHMDIMIIDESVCKDDIKYILDFFSRDPEMRDEFYVLVGKSDDVLNITTPLENISSNNILRSLEANSNYLGTTNLVTYNDFVDMFLNDNIEIALPSVYVVGNKKNGEDISNMESTDNDASSILSDIAVFKKNKLLGYLNETESIAYNFVMDNINGTLIRNDYENKQFVINEVINSKSNVLVDVDKNKVKIEIKGKAAISEVNYDCDLYDSKTIKKIEKDLNNKIESLIKDNVNNIIKKYDSDIFGFADMYYKKDPKKFKKMKDKWYEDYFKNIDIEVKSDVNIFEKGNLNGGLYDEK